MKVDAVNKSGKPKEPQQAAKKTARQQREIQAPAQPKPGAARPAVKIWTFTVVALIVVGAIAALSFKKNITDISRQQAPSFAADTLELEELRAHIENVMDQTTQVLDRLKATPTSELATSTLDLSEEQIQDLIESLDVTKVGTTTDEDLPNN